MCLGACAPKHSDYSHFETLSDQGWAYGDTVTFTPAKIEHEGLRRLAVAVRHNNDYEYSNLWLEITLSDSLTVRRDTVNIILADRFGRWKGSGIGPSIQTQATVSPDMNITGESQVAVRHVMRVDTLRGIDQIGITVDNPDNN